MTFGAVSLQKHQFFTRIDCWRATRESFLVLDSRRKIVNFVVYAGLFNAQFAVLRIIFVLELKHLKVAQNRIQWRTVTVWLKQLTYPLTSIKTSRVQTVQHPQFRKDYKLHVALFLLFAAWFLTQEVNKGFE